VFFAVTAVTSYNDLFGFFIWPLGSSTRTNVATLPGSGDAVGIGSVHPFRNTGYYVSNVRPTAPHRTEMDGMTTLLTTARYNVVAGTTYRLKLAICESEAPAQHCYSGVLAQCQLDCAGGLVYCPRHACVPHVKACMRLGWGFD
jgi:hypothetical protein